MKHARDDVYCWWTARRAVARAGIHVGIESMSVEVLDTLADILIAYIERIGTTMAASVQASGRTSAHCHVLDALRAIETCTEAAAQRVHMGVDGSSLQQQQQSHEASSLSLQWKGLAAFVLGPQWNTITSDSDAPTEGFSSGKVGPSLTATTTGIPHASGKPSHPQGWNAPYPDEIPLFPIAPTSTANPHPFPEPLSEPLYTNNNNNTTLNDDGTQDTTTTTATPDAIFTTDWGASSGVQLATTNSTTDAAKEVQHPAKKQKLHESHPDDRPPYIPLHFPLFPPTTDALARTVVDMDDDTEDPVLVDSTPVAPAVHTHPRPVDSNVRSALVQLDHHHHHHWGSGWDVQESATAFAPYGVPSGRSEGGTSSSQPHIVPLGRASISRVSRILEGSLDATVT
jgi:hypothetical protein